MKKHTAAAAAPSVDDCRTFRQLRNYYQRKFGITLHTDDEDRVNEMLAGRKTTTPPTYVLEAMKMHYNTKDPVQKHVPGPGVYYYLIWTSGTPCKADTVFSPRIKDDLCLCVEKEWGQCKEYHNPELTKDVFHDLERDDRSDLTFACRMAPSLRVAKRENAEDAREVRFSTLSFSTKSKRMARKHIYSGLYIKQLKRIARDRFRQHREAIAHCPVPLTVIGRDYDGPKTKLPDGTTLHTSVVVTYPELCKRVGDVDFSFGHMYVLMAALKGCIGDFGARFLVPPA